MFLCTQNTNGLNQESDREEQENICVYTAGCEHTEGRCIAGRDMSKTYTPVLGPGRSFCPNSLSLYKESFNPQNMLFQLQTQYYKNYARKAVSHTDQTFQSYYNERMEKKFINGQHGITLSKLG